MRAAESSDPKELDRLPNWQLDEVRIAKRVLESQDSDDERFISIEPISSRQGFRHMEEFIETVRNDGLREKLDRALCEHRAFLRFKDMLETNPREKDRWYEFKNGKTRKIMEAWLKTLEVDGIELHIERGFSSR